MSYGRFPYYIFESNAGFEFWSPAGLPAAIEFEYPPVKATVPRAAMAQFVASLAWRGAEELQELIDEGLAMRPDLVPITVTVDRTRYK